MMGSELDLDGRFEGAVGGLKAREDRCMSFFGRGDDAVHGKQLGAHAAACRRGDEGQRVTQESGTSERVRGARHEVFELRRLELLDRREQHARIALTHT